MRGGKGGFDAWQAFDLRVAILSGTWGLVEISARYTLSFRVARLVDTAKSPSAAPRFTGPVPKRTGPLFQCEAVDRAWRSGRV